MATIKTLHNFLLGQKSNTMKHWQKHFNPVQEPYETSYDHIQKRIDYGSLVRNNLMYREGYTPYCGAQTRCFYNWPRMSFNGKQFTCRCGFVTQHHPEFIAEYKAKWGLK